MTTIDERPAAPPGVPGGSAVRRGDRIFRALSSGSGIFLLVIMAAIALFLVTQALPALRENTANFFTTREWDASGPEPRFGIAALAWGTVVGSILALVLAVPVAVGIALFISHYAPRRLAGPLGYVVDLLAAVPSVIYGAWGLLFLVPRLVPLHRWLNEHLGFVPFFGGQITNARTLFTVGIVLAIMILPIVAAVTREVFLQVPRAHEEAALALGATRWEMIRTAVLPFGRPGIISASMLGLGRALGETIAVALVLSPAFVINPRILEAGGITFAQNIVLRFSEADEVGVGALIASGLVLFIITLLVNMAARIVIARRAAFSGASG
ncbi:MAG: phosphate ABC transporter permease subunit PstC [Actinomycetota bacterium]|nr:phosphate ABC transporter permease subunit PstC [Actinomycetota bacterium]